MTRIGREELMALMAAIKAASCSVRDAGGCKLAFGAEASVNDLEHAALIAIDVVAGTPLYLKPDDVQFLGDFMK